MQVPPPHPCSHQAPALCIYSAVKGKAQVHQRTQGLWVQQGKLTSLYDSMDTPSRSSDDLELLPFTKKFKVHHLKSSLRLLFHRW